MANIKRWSSASDAQKAMCNLPDVSKHWKESHYWREFTNLRRAFLSNYKVEGKLNETKRDELQNIFKEWVRSHDEEWWGGGWAEFPGFADWHVNQHIRTAKKGRMSLLNDSGSSGEAWQQTPLVYWDPARNAEDAGQG